MRLRKKPLEIEAVRFIGPGIRFSEYPMWVKDLISEGKLFEGDKYVRELNTVIDSVYLKTPDGDKILTEGDYLVQNEIPYLLSKDTVESEYELADTYPVTSYYRGVNQVRI